MPISAILINAIAFQISWFAALYGGIYDHPIAGALPACLAWLWHVHRMRENFSSEIRLLIAIVLLGFVIESLFITLGTITYVGAPLFGFGPPLWILAMWLAFATLPHGCLNWLHGKWMLQILLGGLIGPLSYLAGGKLGGAALHEPMVQSLASIGIGWAIALPVIFWVADRLAGDQNSA